MKYLLLFLLIGCGANGTDGKDGTAVDLDYVPKAWSHSIEGCVLLSGANLTATYVKLGFCHYDFIEPLANYNNDAYVVLCTGQESAVPPRTPAVCTVSNKTPQGFDVYVYDNTWARYDGPHDILVMGVM